MVRQQYDSFVTYCNLIDLQVLFQVKLKKMTFYLTMEGVESKKVLKYHKKNMRAKLDQDTV